MTLIFSQGYYLFVNIRYVDIVQTLNFQYQPIPTYAAVCPQNWSTSGPGTQQVIPTYLAKTKNRQCIIGFSILEEKTVNGT